MRVLLLGVNVLGSTSREGFSANRCYACGQPTALPFASSSPPSGVNYCVQNCSMLEIAYLLDMMREIFLSPKEYFFYQKSRFFSINQFLTINQFFSISSIARRLHSIIIGKCSLVFLGNDYFIFICVRECLLKQGHIVAPSSRRTSDRFVKPAIPPTIVSPGGPPTIAPNPTVNPVAAPHPGSPMDIAKT